MIKMLNLYLGIGCFIAIVIGIYLVNHFRKIREKKKPSKFDKKTETETLEESAESSKGFQISDLLPIALTFVVMGIGIVYGLNVMSDVANTSGINATTTVSSLAGALPSNLPLIVNFTVAAIIIGILIRFLMVRFDNGE